MPVGEALEVQLALRAESRPSQPPKKKKGPQGKMLGIAPLSTTENCPLGGSAGGGISSFCPRLPPRWANATVSTRPMGKIE